MTDLPGQLENVAALADPVRRTLYRHVLGQPEPVSREQVAEACGVARHTAKFHLDKLAAAGLLEVEYRRLSGRSGPGAGRPAKLYRRSEQEVALSVPPRRYDLAGEVLAEAVDRAMHEGLAVDEAVARVADEVGRELGAAAAQGPAARVAGTELERTQATLGAHGYEPRLDESELCLANCPFDRLAADHTELVCGMNLALIDGVLAGLRTESLAAWLAPQPGFCCVKVAPRARG